MRPLELLRCCTADGECLFCTEVGGEGCFGGEQPETACGVLGGACADCTQSDELCSAMTVADLDGTPRGTAGLCAPQGCADCTDSCCIEGAEGEVTCGSESAEAACGAPGQVCSICSDSETCINDLCIPNADTVFELTLLNAEVPDEGPPGSSVGFHSLSAPDVRVVARVQTSPETIGEDIDGPDDTRQPSFLPREPAVILSRAEFQEGILFDFIDRDPLDPNDDMATIPLAAYVPPDSAFVGQTVITVSEPPYVLQFRFEPAKLGAGGLKP